MSMHGTLLCVPRGEGCGSVGPGCPVPGLRTMSLVKEAGGGMDAVRLAHMRKARAQRTQSPPPGITGPRSAVCPGSSRTPTSEHHTV